MDIIGAITQRRSVKYFDPSHQLTQVEIDRLFSLALLSPTAFNIQNWRFVVGQDFELRAAPHRKLGSSPSDRSILVGRIMR